MKALTANPANATNLTNVVPNAVSYGAGSPGSYTLTGLVIGQAYCWIPGANETSIVVNANVTLAKADLPAGGCFTATATTATMKGTGSALVTAIVSMTTLLYPTTITPTLPVRQITLGQIPAANPNWVRQIQCSDEFVFIKRPPSYAVAISLADFVNIGLSQELNLTWTPPIILTQPAPASCVHSSTAAKFTVVPGSEYVLSYNWQYSSDGGATWANATGTINGTVYTNNTTATLPCTPTTTGQTGFLHRCVVTDNAGSYGLTNGSITTNAVALTIT